MSIDEIIRTCSNEKVAQAAVASLGSAFASRVKTAAEFRGLSVGSFAARIVRDFDDDAPACERSAVDRAMERADQPILRGLEIILERALEEKSAFARGWHKDFKNAVARSGCFAAG